MQEWIQKETDRLISKYGTVPPPWTIFDEHPYSICWRMGYGESHLEVWWKWWSEQNLPEDEKIAYFRKYSPPYCWLKFLIEAIWVIDSFTEKNLSLYFIRTDELGFGNQQDYEKDLDDPKWLK